MDTTQLDAELRKAMKNVGKSIKSRLLTPTTTWSTRPLFIIYGPALIGSNLKCVVVTDDYRYFFLDMGTKVRYATMTPDFYPKTRPNSFTAGAGRGGVAFINKKRARPGISSRNWTLLSSREYSPVLQNAVDKVIAKYDLGAKKKLKSGISGFRR